MRHGSLARWLRLLLVASVLALTFAAYLQPAFVFDLANRWWLCL